MRPGFNNICRLCLKFNVQLIDIFKHQMSSTTNMCDMILKLTATPIFEGDGLPSQICSDCLESIYDFVKYMELCQNSFSFLQKFVLTQNADKCITDYISECGVDMFQQENDIKIENCFTVDNIEHLNFSEKNHEAQERNINITTNSATTPVPEDVKTNEIYSGVKNSILDHYCRSCNITEPSCSNNEELEIEQVDMKVSITDYENETNKFISEFVNENAIFANDEMLHIPESVYCTFKASEPLYVNELVVDLSTIEDNNSISSNETTLKNKDQFKTIEKLLTYATKKIKLHDKFDTGSIRRRIDSNRGNQNPISAKLRGAKSLKRRRKTPLEHNNDIKIKVSNRKRISKRLVKIAKRKRARLLSEIIIDSSD